jgi:hypothetical protein
VTFAPSSVCELNMITGNRGDLKRIAATVSTPFRPGISTSRMTTSGRSDSNLSSAA